MKPPYSVPSMEDIRKIPWNGFNVVSTFSGAGGSSTGYRMAGFRVLWASEFIDEARRTYAANKASYTIVDGRDIRNVTPSDILSATKLAEGELDLLDGSPPCASFSTAGKREAGWGKVKSYSDKEQRTDDLFYEFARLVRGIQPRTFVAENVSGLVKGTAKGYFLRILAELKGCGYRVEAKLLDAQWLGVPQARQRIIFVGVRNDLGTNPVFPKPLPYNYTVRDAIPYALRHGTAPSHKEFVSSKGNIEATLVDSGMRAAPTIMASMENKSAGYIKTSRVVHDTSGQWSTGDVTDRPCPTITVGINSVNSNRFKVVEADADMSRYAVGAEWKKLKPGGQSERFFSLTKPHPDQPCPTVTASGGNASTASVSHPTECRKFSIAELKRICGFPDDFILLGTYQQQWERCGRAVPPCYDVIYWRCREEWNSF